MEELIPFLWLNPLHNHNLDAKVGRITELREQLMTVKKTFQKYSRIGKDLCNAMHKLMLNFQTLGNTASDPTIDTIASILGSFSSTLESYFQQVDDNIGSSISTFIREDIDPVIELHKDSTQKYNFYTDYTDKLVAFSKKKSDNDYIERDKMRLVHHWKAIEASFNLSNAIERVDRKKVIEVTAVFLSFIQTTAVSFKQCNFEFEQNKDAFQALQQALPQSQMSIREFSQAIERNGKTLDGLFTTKVVNPEGVIAEDVTEFEGFLWKKGSGITKSWQRRYFICKNNTLAYYHNYEDSKTPTGKLELLLTSVKPINDSERRNCFQIISQEKTYTLQALTEREMRNWLQVIQNNIQFLLNNSSPSTSIDTHDMHEDTAPPFYLNEVCADCGAPNPVWCCINWGTIICIHCSGVHRSLNTTISKVRSLTLDHIDNMTIELMQRIGNTFANSVLEERVGNEKIGPGVEKRVREEFIRKKYSQSAFITEDVPNFDHLDYIKAGDLEMVYRAICYGRILRENNGYGSLHMAASSDHPLITLLLAYNATNVSSLDECGWSALSYAAYYGKYQNAEILINAGCDPTKSTVAHPYEVARNMGHQELAALFLPYWSGNPNPPPRTFEVPVDTNLSSEERAARIRSLKISALTH